MEHHHWSWDSPTLGRTASLAVWGHYGKPILVFPTWSGGAMEVAEKGLVAALAPLIDAGRIKVYSVDSIAREAWGHGAIEPAGRSALQAAYDRFLVDEVFPRLDEDCGGIDSGYGVAGSAHGAHNAVTAAAKHPGRFDLCVGMSGSYEFDSLVGAHRDGDYYFNMPLYFVPNLSGEPLDALRQGLVVLATGRGRWEQPEQSERMAHVLREKGVPVRLEVWGKDCDHDWPTWRTMLPLFLGRSC